MANPQPESWEYEGPVDYMKILARKREIPKEVGAEPPLRNSSVDSLSTDGASLGKPLDYSDDIEQKLSENLGDSGDRFQDASSFPVDPANGRQLPSSSSSQQFPSRTNARSTGAPMPYVNPPLPSGPPIPRGNPIPRGQPPMPSGPPPPMGNPPLPPGPPPPRGNPPLPPGPPPSKPAIISDFRKAAPVPDSVKGPAPPPASVSAFRNPPPFASRPAHPLGFPEGIHAAFPLAAQAAPEQRKPQRRPRGFSLSSNFRRTVDSYERVCQVGGGTYGDVFKARDRESGDIVALKKVRLEDEKEGFPVTALREIKFLSQMAQVDNPNIVKLKEVVTSKASDTTRNKGSVFMVFEYAECDLVGLMKSRKLSEPHIMCLLKQLLEAVHVAHVNQVLHRDIKPSNVLVNSQGILKLADWGLCRKWVQGYKYTNRVVTLWYRAPELLLGEQQYTSAIDMWAVGCLMAELLIGRALFPGKDEVNQLKLILELCGKPDKDQLPAGWENLPLAKDFLFGEATPSQMQMRFAFLRPQAKDLIFRLLELDPSKRISAKDALSHDYFWGTDPAPCDPSFLPIPKGDGLHEYQLREEQARKQQEANSHHDKRWKA